MGNKPCRVGLKLDEPNAAHEAGELVKGRIYFAVSSSEDSSAFRDIHLVLEGQEAVEITHRTSSHRHDVESNKSCWTKSLVQSDYPIVCFNNGLRPGQYEYPFQIRLPSDLPSTMVCRDSHRNSAEIRYTLSACVGKQNESFRKVLANGGNLRDSTSLFVAAKSSVRGQPVNMPAEEFLINTCFFWNNGNIRMGWQASTDVVSPGGSLSVEMFGENQSNLQVNYLAVKIVETVEFRAGQQFNRAGQQYSQKSVKRTIVRQKVPVDSFPWWRPYYSNGSVGGAYYRSLTGTDSSLPSSAHPHRVELKLPHDVRHSYAGDLISVRHMLVLTAETTGGCTTTSPESAYQIQIVQSGATESAVSAVVGQVGQLARPVEDHTDFVQAEVLPPDWNPTVADDVIVVSQAWVLPQEEAMESAPALTPSAPPEFFDRTYTDPGRPSVSELQAFVESCPENLEALLDDRFWVELIRNLSPRDFCTTVQKAGRQHGAGVARTLALAMGANMTTRHVIACIYALSDSSLRMDVVLQTTPLASDLTSNLHLIEQELTEDELSQFRLHRNQPESL